MTSVGPTPYYLSPQRTDLDFLDAPEIPTVVRKVVDYPLSEMATAMDGTVSVLFALLETEGIHPTGPPFSLYEHMSGETATFEIGVPVDRRLDGPVTAAPGVVIEGSVLPGGTLATISHIGSYDRLGDAWGAFMEAVTQAGKTAELPFWEIYLTEPGPGVDPETMRTDLVTRIAR